MNSFNLNFVPTINSLFYFINFFISVSVPVNNDWHCEWIIVLAHLALRYVREHLFLIYKLLLFTNLILCSLVIQISVSPSFFNQGKCVGRVIRTFGLEFLGLVDLELI